MRSEVQECLGGRVDLGRARELRRELAIVGQAAPEQARTLLERYCQTARLQEGIIEREVERQGRELNSRIQRRSSSRRRSGGSIVEEVRDNVKRAVLLE